MMRRFELRRAVQPARSGRSRAMQCRCGCACEKGFFETL
jgi:hypothetical protein